MKQNQFKNEIKKASDFQYSVVNPSIKNPTKLVMKPGCFKISGDGVFYSLQGEGKSMGLPSCFLRLHLCNLRCGWCDAWYTWNPNTPEFWQESQDWSIEKTKNKIEESWICQNPHVTKRLIITGGEPLLQKNQINSLIDIMPKWKFEIETNGTIMPTEKILSCFQINCSPKLRNSGNPHAARVKKNVLKTLNQVNTIFKFVVMNNNDIDEIEADFVKKYSLDVSKIILMPQGVTSDEVKKNMIKVVEYSKKKGYRLMGRLHCDIWGARRRV